MAKKDVQTKYLFWSHVNVAYDAFFKILFILRVG